MPYLRDFEIDYVRVYARESTRVATRDGVFVPRKDWPEQTPDVITVSLQK